MIEFNVPDMSCGHCVSMVTKAVKSVDPDAKVEVNLAARKVKVESGGRREEIASALAEAGYPPSV